MKKITQKSSCDILEIEKKLRSRIFGQDHIIDNVIDMIGISMAGLSDDTKPIASFLFTGPTGVGKTELAKELATLLNKELIRFDMSEYADEHSAQTLLGGQAGLVGYEDGGLLTNAIIKNSNAILLLDEIEKAHHKAYNTFLQVLDYGMLTDTKGRKANFTQTIIIMTSNLGANEQNGIGFGNKNLYKQAAILDFLPPEFRNRIDKILEFKKLTKEIIIHITEKFLNDLSNQLSKKNLILSITTNAKNVLNDIGFDPNMGARAVLRAINTEFKKEISRILLAINAKSGIISVDYINERFIYSFLESCPNPISVKNLFEMSVKKYDFFTAEEAQKYARNNIGTVVVKSSSGVGYVIK